MSGSVSASGADEATVVDGEPASEAPSGVRELQPGATLHRYVLIEKVGEGAMGVVMRAYDPRLQREVALKVVRTHALSEEGQARMLREARAMAQLSHPHIVAVYDVHLQGGQIVIAMEYVPGVTLGQWIRGASSPDDVVLGAFLQAGRGLAAMHARGLLHRDFKPSNVLLDPFVDDDETSVGRVKVTDLGLARAEGRATSSQTTASQQATSSEPSIEVSADGLQTLTADGVVVGTWRYMAPEQHAGEELTQAVDQYAFCVALWEALSGSPPFSGSAREVAAAKAAGPPSWPASVPIAARVRAAITRGLQPRSQDRWPSMDALLDALAPPVSSRRKVIAAATTAAVLTMGVGLWWGWAPGESPCTAGAEQITQAWDANRRDRIHALIQGRSDGAAAAVDELDAYAGRWADKHRQVCEATAMRREQSQGLMDLRMYCLRRAKMALHATATLLEQEHSGPLPAAAMAKGLPSLQQCDDIEALQAVLPPADLRQQPQLEELYESLARADALLAAGQHETALTVLSNAGDGAVAMRDDRALHELKLRRGRAQAALGRVTEAEASLRDALRGATADRMLPVIEATAAELAGLLRRDPQREAEAEVFERIAAYGRQDVPAGM